VAEGSTITTAIEAEIFAHSAPEVNRPAGRAWIVIGREHVAVERQ
jgi:hypothetical protein